jgi:transposase
MLSFTGGLKVFVALEPCDPRKSFNGRHALVSERLGEDPRQGRSSSLPTGGGRG